MFLDKSSASLAAIYSIKSYKMDILLVNVYITFCSKDGKNLVRRNFPRLLFCCARRWVSEKLHNDTLNETRLQYVQARICHLFLREYREWSLKVKRHFTYWFMRMKPASTSVKWWAKGGTSLDRGSLVQYQVRRAPCVAMCNDDVLCHIATVRPYNTEHLIIFLHALNERLGPSEEGELLRPDLNQHVIIWDNFAFHHAHSTVYDNAIPSCIHSFSWNCGVLLWLEMKSIW